MLIALVLAFVSFRAFGQYPSTPQIFKDGTALAIEDYASAPISSMTTAAYPPATNYGNYLGRLNFLRSEPANAPRTSERFFVNDLNRNLYVLTKSNKTFTIYINFEEVYPKFVNYPGYSGGIVTFAFDPDYASNGKFYTIHTENPARSGSAVPTNGSLHGFNVTGYTLTPAVNPPAGTVVREAVLVEWTDTNINNATFEGTARELLRLGCNNVIHPMGDLAFNPLAHPGDSDYGNLYIAAGEGGAGEVAGATHTTPQRLDTLHGKILRITPDTNAHPADGLAANGRYRIPTTGPDPNPFVSLTLTNLKKEIFAYGFKNPHRLSWDPPSNKIFVTDIGLSSWEEVNIIVKGANYGYAEREGIEQVFIGGSNNEKTGSQTTPPTPFPNPDSLTVTGIVGSVTPRYPVAAYSHREGDGITSGFVYRGSLMPQMDGKYFFGDITTARLFYSQLSDLIASDDSNRTNLAPIHELQVVYNGVERRLYDLVRDEFVHKGGIRPSGGVLPGNGGGLRTDGIDPYGVAYGGGRADIRLAMPGDGEIYILSKSDGMIRRLVAAIAPPVLQAQPGTNGLVTLIWASISNHHYRLQYKSSVLDTNWTDLSGDVTATNSVATKTDALSAATRFYRVVLLP